MIEAGDTHGHGVCGSKVGDRVCAWWLAVGMRSGVSRPSGSACRFPRGSRHRAASCRNILHRVEQCLRPGASASG